MENQAPTSKNLFSSERVEVKYWPNSDGYALVLKTKGPQHGYFLAHSILEELATTELKDRNFDNGIPSELYKKLHAVNDVILADATQRGIATTELHLALIDAYKEEQRRLEDFKARMLSLHKI